MAVAPTAAKLARATRARFSWTRLALRQPGTVFEDGQSQVALGSALAGVKGWPNTDVTVVADLPAELGADLFALRSGLGELAVRDSTALVPPSSAVRSVGQVILAVSPRASSGSAAKHKVLGRDIARDLMFVGPLDGCWPSSARIVPVEQLLWGD
jgi:hypothetical protein